ncbi:CYTH domain-containing protein [Marinobacterium lutimaris]|uniref:CYTH domain-containing protein n=1 Tax=Marinobacterium lutimaris TaxID=568106 RepID=A0A1H6DB79_9GAMM|nr:CYTH domain-containing protein [Marinobacterium lutimaris]SEG82697.1 CYTH domain-containing protein [Marinobacterium lutimaris]
MGAETELKLGLLPEYGPEVAGLPILEQYAKAEPECRQLDNTYFDTPDHALTAARVALRIRRDGERYIQTLKTAGDGRGGLSVRGEWEWELAEPVLELDKVRAHLPPQLNDDALLTTLEPVFDTNFERHIWLLGGGEGAEAWQVEMALDRGEIRAGLQSTELSELELELKSGPTEALFQLALEIARQIPVQVRDDSKAQRGYALAGLQRSPFRVELAFKGGEDQTLVELISDCLKAWPAQLAKAIAGDDSALQELNRTLDLMLVALESQPDIAAHCQVLISQYQRLRADTGRAWDWRLLEMMPTQWRQKQHDQAAGLLQGLSRKTLPGQLALATGELLWQIDDDED